jgi:DNA-binding Lrp family transcriptional regulator
MNGYIKLYRKMVENPMWLSEPFDRPRAWIDLLMLTNHRPGYIRVRGIRVPVERGQCGWSQTKLAERWQWSRGKVRRFIDELVKDGMIEQQTVQQNKRLIILNNIINYEHYQGNGTTNDTTNGHQTDIKQYSNKNEKNEKNNIIPPEEPLQGPPDPSIEIDNLISAYPNPGIIYKAIEAIATTRKLGKVSQNIILAELKKWQKYPPERVEQAIDLYLDKDYAGDGKGESYLLGIMRNHKPKRKNVDNYPKPRIGRAPEGWSA